MSNITSSASQLVKKHGASLVGCIVYTAPMGEWPGGRARVEEIAPDPAAPEIVFNVRHVVDWVDKEHGSTGVFAFERVTLLTEGNKK